MVTDLIFLAATNSAVRFHSMRGATVYYYWFDYRGSNSFMNLLMNPTIDLGEYLQFVEHVKYLQ
jgi:carboxylesterase type B